MWVKGQFQKYKSNNKEQVLGSGYKKNDDEWVKEIYDCVSY